MKMRLRKTINFFALNLLFFALYLNFINKYKQPVAIETEQAKQNSSAFGGTVLVDNKQQQLPAKKTVIVAPASKDIKAEEEKTNRTLKLSIN